MRRYVEVVLCAVLLAACTEPAPVSPASSSSAPSPTTTAPRAPAAPSPSSAVTSPPAAEPTPAPADPPAPQFAAATGPITGELATRMASSWRPGCPVPLEDLRHLTLTHHGFAGEVLTGELVVHADAAEAITGVFRSLFEAGYPIRSMRLVDDFGGDDAASMAADNTSAFNCRSVAGTRVWSEHAYGRAIDVNPVENPYVSRSGVYPPAGADFADRPDLPGVIHADDAVARAFADVGWGWGGTWLGARDYQHFSATGR